MIIFVLIVLPPCAFLGYEKRYFYLSRGNVFVIWWARITCGIQYEVEGLGNVPEQACVVVSNHQSAWETYLLGLLFIPQATVLKLGIKDG
jgi:1-acyl-sn-glycerol-3-phosphate acyltransferase